MDKTSKNKPWSGKQISGYQVDWLVINSIMRSILWSRQGRTGWRAWAGGGAPGRVLW